MEGPYYNGNFGANRHLNIWGDREITSDDYTRLVNAGGKDVKVWMIAPEREGLIPFMKYAREVNPEVKFAFGHCKATPDEIRALGKYRPTIQTHSMNATGRTPHTNGLRAWGPDEYAFMEPEVYCELISDSLGIHVNREMQQLLLHTKGLHRVILITDSTNYNNPIPEKFAHVTDLNFDPKGGIAGSRLTMDAACRNIMAHTNCGIAEAFILAAGNPARAIGMDDEIGSIERGKRCDLVFVDDIFNVKEVILGGEICDI
jgi:N-acetylglucosamine-6-phosphate deacetylase